MAYRQTMDSLGWPKMGMSQERSDEVAHFVQGAIIDSKSWVTNSGQPYFIAYGQAMDSWGRPKMGMSQERSDEVAHFVQGV